MAKIIDLSPTLLREEIKTELYQLGLECWQEYVTLADKSMIPSEFLYAANKYREINNLNYADVSLKIFGNLFGTRAERTYAIAYSSAISATKLWTRLNVKLHENLELLEQREKDVEATIAVLSGYSTQLKCEPEDVVRKLIEYQVITDSEATVLRGLSSLLYQIKESKSENKDLSLELTKLLAVAQISCGTVVQLDRASVPTSRLDLHWWLGWFLGFKISSYRRNEVIREIENFFSLKSNQSRIALLGC